MGAAVVVVGRKGPGGKLGGAGGGASGGTMTSTRAVTRPRLISPAEAAISVPAATTPAVPTLAARPSGEG